MNRREQDRNQRKPASAWQQRGYRIKRGSRKVANQSQAFGFRGPIRARHLGLGGQSESGIGSKDPSSPGIKGELSRNLYFQPGAQVMLMQMPMLGKRQVHHTFFYRRGPGSKEGKI